MQIRTFVALIALALSPAVSLAAENTAAPVTTPVVTLATTAVTATRERDSHDDGCVVESVNYSACLAANADHLVRQDPTKPKAVMVYEISLTNRSTGEVQTVDVLAAPDRTVTDAVGSARFTLQVGSMAGGAVDVQFSADGVAGGVKTLGKGQGATLALNDAQTITITRL